MTHVALRIVNNVSCVTRTSHGTHFSWQAQYLVSLDYDTLSHFSWQAQYLVSLDNDTCYSAHCK